MLKFTDIFFVVFHTLLILFNLFGWIFRYTRRMNLYTLLATGASWFILGIFYGTGYCPLTDWHFQVLTRMGETGLPYSYIKYLFDRITGGDINANLTDTMTIVLYFSALIISILLNTRDFIRKKQNRSRDVNR